MPSVDEQFNHMLGVVIGKLEGIEHRLDKAESSRADMYQRFEKHNAEVADLRRMIQVEVSELRHLLQDLAGRITEAEARIAKVLDVAARVEGYERDGRTIRSALVFIGKRLGTTGKFIAGAGGVAVVAFWREIVEFIKGLGQ
jgi:hypothetical protein